MTRTTLDKIGLIVLVVILIVHFTGNTEVFWRWVGQTFTNLIISGFENS